MTKSTELYATGPQLAEWMRVSGRQVRTVLREAGVRAVRGRGYPLSEVVRALHWRRADRESRTSELTAQEARLKKAQADLRESELAERRGYLVHVTVLSQAATEFVGAHKSRLLSLPARVAPALAFVTEREARSVLDAATYAMQHEIYAALGELLDTWAARAEELEKDGK